MKDPYPGYCCGERRKPDMSRHTAWAMCHAKCHVCEKVEYLPIGGIYKNDKEETKLDGE